MYALRHLIAILACLALTAGCRFGAAVSLFEEDNGVAQAVKLLRERIGGHAYALNIVISPDEVLVRTQNASNRSKIDEWRLERKQFAFFSWEQISGPNVHQLNLVNPDLEANLFDLDNIDFSSMGSIARAARERAALANQAKIMRVEIARQVFVLPRPASGEVRWIIDVSSGNESAQVFTDTDGRIVATNLDGTARAKSLDIYRKLDTVADAVNAFRFILGSERSLLRVSVGQKSVSFETNVPDANAPVEVSGTLRSRKIYRWTINGLARAEANADANDTIGQVRTQPFSVDEVDWTALPNIAASAAQRLALPEGRITNIEIAKTTNSNAPAILLWKIEVTDQNGAKGSALFDTAGGVKQVIPPDTQRKRTDWYNPKTIIDTRDRLGATFGMERRIAELEARALELLKLPPQSTSSITIGRGSPAPSPHGNVTIEIEAGKQPSGAPDGSISSSMAR